MANKLSTQAIENRKMFWRNFSYYDRTFIIWFTIISMVFLALTATVFKAVRWFIHWAFDEPTFKETMDKIILFFYQSMNMNIFKDWRFPDTRQWPEKWDAILNIPLMDIFIFSLIVIAIAVLMYIFSFFIRHRMGEHAPYKDDAEARRIKWHLKRATTSNIRSLYDEEDKKLRKLEKAARFKLRRMRVLVYTEIKKGQVNPTKDYRVRIKRHMNTEVNNIVQKKIKGLDDTLSALIGISFGQQAVSANKRYYLYESSIEVDRKEAFAVKRRRKKKNGGKAKEIEEVGSEYAFPLELFVDNSEKIYKQKVKADEHAEILGKSVPSYLASMGISAELGKSFSGKTSVQQVYKLQFTKNLPNVENIAEGLDNALNTTGVLVKLSAGSMNITIPLPAEAIVPIDYKSMITEKF